MPVRTDISLNQQDQGISVVVTTAAKGSSLYVLSKVKPSDHMIFSIAHDALFIAAELIQAGGLFGVNCLLFAN